MKDEMLLLQQENEQFDCEEYYRGMGFVSSEELLNSYEEMIEV